jgi:enolase
MRPTIKSLHPRKILDSRGEWTTEVIIKLSSGLVTGASVPQGKSKGSHEAVYVSVDKATDIIKKIIEPKIKGKSLGEQKAFDSFLIDLDGTENKSWLGANSTLGLSLVYARASALSSGIPLWRYIREVYGEKTKKKPYLYLNLINGGLHAGNNLDFQEYLIIPETQSYIEGIGAAVEIYQGMKKYLIEKMGAGASNLGDEGGCAPYFPNAFAPFEILEKVIQRQQLPIKIMFGLDAAANNIKKKPAELSNAYKAIIDRFGLFYLEDPYKENDFASFESFLKTTKKPLIICGDDLTVTNINRIKKAYDRKSINAVVIKPNQIGTLSEALDAARFARKCNYFIIVSHRSGETNDDFIVDLAHGIGADGIKIGAPARGERVAKFNRFLEIEKEH